MANKSTALELVFAVQGSAAEPYEIRFSRMGGDVSARCTCQAGLFGQHCKHRVDLIVGEVTNLVSDNRADVILLKDMLEGTDIETAFKEYQEAEADCERARKRVAVAKKRLAQAFN